MDCYFTILHHWGFSPSAIKVGLYKGYIMEWFEKFKVGQKVKVVKGVKFWYFKESSCPTGATWDIDMDITIGKVFEIICIDKNIGYRLKTDKITHCKYNYWYPMESLRILAGRQLLFDFMEG